MPAPAVARAAPSPGPALADGSLAAAAATRDGVAVVRPTLLATGAGALQGALLYGGAVALLHAGHNSIGAWNALVVLAWCLLVYGAAAAVAAGVAMLALRLARRAASRATATERAARRDLWLATGAFHAVFWVFAASYGLTYDEAPGWASSAWPMLGYLVLRSAVVVALALGAGWLLVALGGALARRRWLKASTVASAVALAIAQVALAHDVAPRAKPAMPPTFGAAAGLRVAVVGVDGADWRVALPMVEAGKLPHLAALMKRGSWGPLRTFPDSNSAVIWASIYSGRRPETHGALDFYTIRLAGMTEGFPGVYPVHRTFWKELALRLQRLGLAQVQPIERARVAAPLVWEVAQSTGHPVGVVDGYYYSYPAPQLGDARSFFLGYGSDATWQQALRERRPLGSTEAALQAWPATLLAQEGRFLERPDFAWQGDTLLDLLGRYEQPQLVTMYSHEPDAVQHERWRFHEPEKFFGVDRQAAAAHDEVARFYLDLDAFLARLEAKLAPGTVLVVVSDHGHSPTIFHSMDTQHRHGPPGILLLAGGPVRAGRLPADAGVLDVYPTLLYLLGIPLPADADGRLLTAALDPAYLRDHPVARVSTWDGLPSPRSAAPPDEERRRLELERLYNLGYIR